MTNQSTLDKAKDAADQLLLEGKRPTQQDVRMLIGGGSISTINKALNEWWSELGQRMRDKQERPDLPDQVLAQANVLWTQALNHAEFALKERRAALEQELQEAIVQAEGINSEQRIQLDKLIAQNGQFGARLTELEAEKSVLSDEQNSLEKQLIKKTTECENLIRELKQQSLIESRRQLAPSVSNDALVELKVANKLADEENKRLAKQLERLVDENAELKKRLSRADTEAIAKRHALETVIAQQDVRYEQSLKEIQYLEALQKQK